MDIRRIRRVALILLVLLTTVGISASVLLGAHQHDSSARGCGVCLVGHMPWTGPAAQWADNALAMREWRQIVERPALFSEADLRATSSRAPPVL
ncbi:MAG TPA: hypothetical protein VKG25_23385 [Bryobacteraceae bacterium]|nr:hypothetical protein [Bryobacteraceae bacterium]